MVPGAAPALAKAGVGGFSLLNGHWHAPFFRQTQIISNELVLQEMMPALFRWFTKNNGQFGAEMCCESSPQEISKAPGTMASARSEGLEDEKGPVELSRA